MMMTCELCKEEIHGDRKVKYCSLKCSNAMRARRFRGVIEQFEVQKACVVCGTAFYPKNKRSTTCGDSCYSEMLRIKAREASNAKPLDIRKLKYISSVENGTKYVSYKHVCVTHAKCPGCKKDHVVEMDEPGWTGNGIPRIGCSNYPFCARESYQFDCDDTIMPEIYQSDNRGMI